MTTTGFLGPGQQQRQHGIACYRKGCRCETCVKAKKEQWARHRAKQRANKPPPDLDKVTICPFCLEPFPHNWIFRHEETCASR